MAARKKKEGGQELPVKNKQKRTTAVKPADKAGGKIRKTTHHKFTEAARKRYLEHLAEWGTKNRSAIAAGICYATVKNYLAVHPEFILEVDDALEKYRDMLLTEMKERAAKGYLQSPIFNREGEIIGHKLVKSDRLLEVAIKRVDPESRESIQKIEHRGTMVTASVPFDVSLLDKLDKTGRDAMRTVLAQLGAGVEDAGTAPDPSKS